MKQKRKIETGDESVFIWDFQKRQILDDPLALIWNE